MTPGPGPGFDRLRPRVVDDGVTVVPRQRSGVPDPEGRRALYSEAEQAAVPGAVEVECSRCGVTTAVTPRALVALAVPSVHLPLLRRHASWLRCPACSRRSWVRLTIRL